MLGLQHILLNDFAKLLFYTTVISWIASWFSSSEYTIRVKQAFTSEVLVCLQSRLQQEIFNLRYNKTTSLLKSLLKYV